MTPENDDDYCMRGHRVPALAPELIRDVAYRVCKIIGINKASFKNGKAEKVVSRLEHHGIHLDVIEDEEWLDATRATVDPSKGMIYVPNKLYTELCRGKAEAVRIFLHEMGHIVLGHRPLLHFAEEQATKLEDSEWQADYFADAVMELLKLPKSEAQMELKF